MSRIGYGYGSEWHLLRYLGRHRVELDRAILKATGGESLQWRDAPFAPHDPFDGEWKGVDFMRPEEHRVKADWLTTWPQTGNVPNWDAVGILNRNGGSEWLLVEAKAHLSETRSSCGAKPNGGLGQIRAALEEVKRGLGVPSTCDWLKEYYQYCNRVAVLHLLWTHGVAARLLFIYFIGDKGDARRTCPQDAGGWAEELRRLNQHVGLPSDHALADRIHKVFLPITCAL